MVELPHESDGAESCYHLYVVLSEQRERLAAGLAEAGVESRAYYTVPLHRQPALRRFAPEAGLPNAEHVAATSLALPMGPALGGGQVDAIATAARAVLGAA